MKLIYCIRAVYNPGGMERVLLNKVRFLVNEMKWEVVIVTTDQEGKPPFYPFPEQVRMVDLNVNYARDNDKGVFRKITGYLQRKKLHRQRLTQLLMSEKPDVVVSLYPSESSFIPDIPDGSKKVLEIHYCKFFRLQYGRHGLLGLIDRLRTRQDEHIARKFDRFVVLTHEDRGYWGTMPNIEVIPNAAMFMGTRQTDMTNKRILAVGRLDYQKGFDRLLEAWHIVQQHPEFSDWRLDIFGQGEWHDRLEQTIRRYGLEQQTAINPPTSDIGSEYARSSMLVMSSNYEGFPMVMIEAMAGGLPVVAFDFLCGPKDIIRHEQNGLIVPNGNIPALAKAMMQLMASEPLRQKLSVNARKITQTYSEEQVMKQWVGLFRSLTEV